jgi:acylpyruvate hydrolase
MRLVTIRTANGTRAGRLEGDQVVELDFSDVGALLAGGDAAMRAATSADGPRHAYASVDLAPVIPHPPKSICVGQNYMAHIAEMGSQPPDYPTLFAKYTRALIGPRDDIVLPKVSDNVDWEVELAIVIGKEARHVSGDAAMDAVAGWTILNDVSVRDFQRRTAQFLQGKTFEKSTPVGPALVTRDEVDATNLRLVTEVDGKVVQDSSTSDLLFKPVDIIAYISQIITLEPGDIIATGTPSGVGAGRKPPVWLQPGQTMVTRVEGLGELVNRCVKEA